MSKSEPQTFSNDVTPDAIITVSLSKMMKAGEKARSEQGRMRGIYALAEKNGVMLAAAKRAMKILSKDNAPEAVAEMEATLRYVRLLGVDMPAFQPDLFTPEASADAGDKAYEEGLRAGRLGFGDAENPYTGVLANRYVAGVNCGASERHEVMEVYARQEREAVEEDDDEDDATDEGQADVEDVDQSKDFPADETVY